MKYKTKCDKCSATIEPGKPIWSYYNRKTRKMEARCKKHL